jgi:hypothetical protein
MHTQKYGLPVMSVWTVLALSPTFQFQCELTEVLQTVRYTHKHHLALPTFLLTLSARPPFQNFSTPCILNVNNTGAKQGSIMK